jgi:hypothetical protein
VSLVGCSGQPVPVVFAGSVSNGSSVGQRSGVPLPAVGVPAVGVGRCRGMGRGVGVDRVTGIGRGDGSD